jgi:hypothetical protein
MKQIRIERPRIRREHPGREVLPRDARDPDVVRAKALARGRKLRRHSPGETARSLSTGPVLGVAAGTKVVSTLRSSPTEPDYPAHKSHP